MLVLSRKVGEAIVIGEAIRITVVALAGNRIRLGIEAPAAVSILRGELAAGDNDDAGTEASRLGLEEAENEPVLEEALSDSREVFLFTENGTVTLMRAP
jgi:carbon storage regulator